MRKNILTRALAVFILLAGVKARPEEARLRRLERRESGRLLSGPQCEEIQSQEPVNDYDSFGSTEETERLIEELENILEESVESALEAQRLELEKKFSRAGRKLVQSRSFWRKAALGELALILGGLFASGAFYSAGR